MNLDHVHTPYTKIKSKWMKDLNVSQEAIKILEEKTGSNLFDLNYSQLLDMSLEAWETKAKMNYWDLIKLKKIKLLHGEGNNQQNQKATNGMGEDICK